MDLTFDKLFDQNEDSLHDKVPLEEKIYTEIKKAISFHILLPNTQLQEHDLTELFQVSRTPIRVALRRLEYEGLVRIVPRKGAFVTNPSPEEIKKVFYLRRILEGLAAEQSASKITENQVDYLRELVTAEIKSHKEKNRWGVIESSTKFHEFIARINENEWLTKFISELISQCNVYLIFFDPFDAEPPRSVGEHETIIDALAVNDPKASYNAMVTHIESLERHLNLDILKNTGFEAWKKTLSLSE